MRGHKLYWHKDNITSEAIRETNQQKIQNAPKQYTRFRPVKDGVSFVFDIHFENLSDVELGALLWVLHLASDNRYRLKLGMGKPLGMGAVSIKHTVHLSNRTERYRSLLTTEAWTTGLHTMEVKTQDDYVNAFEQYVLSKSGEGEKKITRLQDTLRIQCLLALLSWPGPHVHATRYMEIERNAAHPQGTRPGRENNGKVNEYSYRLVLPTPRQVLNDHPAPTPPAPPVELKKLDIGVEVTGNRKGEIRTPFGSGVRVDLNLKNFETPKGKTVIGFIRKADAAGSLSGGFSGVVDDVEVDGSTVYIILKPRAKEKK